MPVDADDAPVFLALADGPVEGAAEEEAALVLPAPFPSEATLSGGLAHSTEQRR